MDHTSQESPGTPEERPDSTPRRIQHPEPRIGRKPLTPPADDDPLPVEKSSAPAGLTPKIRALGERRRHEDEWTRTPNTTGTGAIHVRTFHGKLTDDSLAYLDQCINEWLDAHPQYEVKFVNTTVGILTGKLKEPHLICQVWV